MKAPGEEARRCSTRVVRRGEARARAGRWLRGGLFLACLALFLGACSHLPGRRAKTAPAAFGEASERGQPLGLPLAVTTAEDYVVRVVAGSVTCTGSLIEEDRV